MKPEDYFSLKSMGFSEGFIKRLGGIGLAKRFGELPERLKSNYRKGKGGEKVWVLAIGINEYEQGEKLPRLKFAEADAEGFVKEMLSKGVRPENICLLTGEKARREEIKRVLGEITEQEGSIYIFYSGHGMFTEKSGFYFTCRETKVEEAGKSAYSMEELKRELKGMKAERAVLLVDACHSGGAKKPIFNTDFVRKKRGWEK